MNSILLAILGGIGGFLAYEDNKWLRLIAIICIYLSGALTSYSHGG